MRTIILTILAISLLLLLLELIDVDIEKGYTVQKGEEGIRPIMAGVEWFGVFI